MEIKNQKIILINKNEYDTIVTIVNNAKNGIITANFNSLIKKNCLYIVKESNL